MKRHIHIIYTPGLGDRYDPIRRACLGVWRMYGVRVTMVPMRWMSDEAYGDKRDRVEEAIHNSSDEKVILMGESAGGSMALALYAEHVDTLAGLVTLCGKNTRSDNVSPYLYRRNPAFQDSMHRAEAVAIGLSMADRRRFVSVVPWYDPTVPVAQTLLPGCQKMTLPAVGHIVSILAMLTIYAPLVVRRIKQV